MWPWSRKSWILLLIGGCSSWPCAVPVMAQATDEPAAVVNGVSISMEEFQRQLGIWGVSQKKIDPDILENPVKLKRLRAALLDSLINDELVLQETARRKIRVKDRDLDNAEKEIKERFRAEADGSLRDDPATEEAFQRQLQEEGKTYAEFREQMRRYALGRKLGEKVAKSPSDWASFLQTLKGKASIERSPAIPAWDDAEEIERAREKAENGDAGAQSDLGSAYMSGTSVPQDYAEARKWFEKAAKQGNGAGQYNLGLLYREGLGVKKNQEEALLWWRKAADQGVVLAQGGMGDLFFLEGGYKQDHSQALVWYRKAAGQNLGAAQSNLGVMYSNGWGTAQDKVEAYAWYLVASVGGNSAARANLAVLNGQLTAEQIAEAKKRSRRMSASLKSQANPARQAQLQAAEKDGDRLLSAGRESQAFDLLTKALQGPWSGDEASTRLRTKYLKLLASLKEPPAVPEAARRHMIRGRALIKEAAGVDAYDKACDEMAQALQIAPWWVEAYYNLALGQEGAKRYGDAIGNLKLYLLGNPGGQDARAVQDKIYALEIQAEGGNP